MPVTGSDRSNHFVVVLAGGRGARLWPLSRPERPKQFLPLEGGEDTMLEVTLRRARRLVEESRVVVVGDRRHEDALRKQAGSACLLLEPFGRNTAAAVAAAAAWIERRSPGAVMVVLSADHVIRNEDHWADALRAAAVHARESGDLVTIGTPARTPETRYGYMVATAVKRRIADLPLLAVERFVEKPDAATLESLLAGGNCYRNMGLFAWRASTMLDEVQHRLPPLWEHLRRWSEGISSDAVVSIPDWVYEDVPSVSVDHAILQSAGHVTVVASSVDRIDVGDYSAFAELWPADEAGNAVLGRFVALDARRNIVYAGGVDIAAVGVDDLVIVSDGDAILICPRNRTQEIRGLMARLQETKTADEQGSKTIGRT